MTELSVRDLYAEDTIPRADTLAVRANGLNIPCTINVGKAPALILPLLYGLVSLAISLPGTVLFHFLALFSLTMHRLLLAKHCLTSLTIQLPIIASSLFVNLLNRVGVVTVHYSRLKILFLHIAATAFRRHKAITQTIGCSCRQSTDGLVHRWTAGASPVLLYH